MNTKSRIAIAASLLFSFTTLFSSADDETLWNLSFKDLADGQALQEVAFKAPCAGPQKVTVDAQNTLTGAKAVGALTPALHFEKKSATNYTPAFTLKADSAYSSGVITVSFDLLFDTITMDAQHPVETLMAFPFLNDKGGSDYVLVVVAEGDSKLNVSLPGAGKALSFNKGDVAHLKATLDLGKHTFQVFLNDNPLTDVLQDDQKYSTFLGLTVRDGTALGGNHGAAFSAGIANLVVTHK